MESALKDHMTCLYCGKKLGFFSRYKDTPFCSEEHVRVHQDELERALMERLGSKLTVPARSLEANASEAPPLKSTLSLEMATSSLEHVAKPAPESAPVATTIAAPPPPLYENYLIDKPPALSALDTGQPFIPLSCFAIIVQADCCTPYSPEPNLNLAFPLEATEFEIDTSGLHAKCTFAPIALPVAFDEAGFSENVEWLRLPASVSPRLDTGVAIFGGTIPLEYSAVPTLTHYNALGHRDELTPRIRHRYPYAASEISSAWNVLPLTGETYRLSAALDWDPILPSTASLPKIEEQQASHQKLAPQFDIPIYIRALANFQLDHAEQQDSSDALVVLAFALSDSAGLTIDCASTTWAAKTILPGLSTSWQSSFNWQHLRASDRVPAVPFPSLFQLGPVLPPSPESSAG